MTDIHEKLKEMIEKFKVEKKPSFIIHSSEDGLLEKIKIDFLDYNFELYINLLLQIEDKFGNSVETSIDQFKFNQVYDVNILKLKLDQTLENLKEELANFKSE